MNEYVTGFSFGGKHDIESATGVFFCAVFSGGCGWAGVFSGDENMCVNPLLGWCFSRRVAEGWIGGMEIRRYGDEG